MSYEIEISYDIQKQLSYTTKLLAKTIELAENNKCDKHFQFTECKRLSNKVRGKIPTPVVIFCFENDHFTDMTTFLQEVMAKYKKNIHIESVYDVENRNIIYASTRYMELMEPDQKDDYKHRRQTRSYSETDYFILRDILKKNY